MIHGVPFRAEHALRLPLQESQLWMAEYLSDEVLKGMEGPHSYTLLDDNEPLVCVGVYRIWDNRAFLWSLISGDIGPHRFVVAARYARRLLAALPFRRVETAVDVDFAAGHRFARMSGFVCEAERMQAFQVDGRDCALYARIKAVV